MEPDCSDFVTPDPHGVVFFVFVLCVYIMLAKLMTCQPWSRFLIYCLLNSGESCLLHPTILRGVTLVRGFAQAYTNRLTHE